MEMYEIQWEKKASKRGKKKKILETNSPEKGGLSGNMTAVFKYLKHCQETEEEHGIIPCHC